MGNELPRFGENTGTPPEYDYSKVFAELGGMIVFELMDVYMNEEHPIFAAPADGDDMTWEEGYKSIPPKSSSRVMLNVVDKGRAFPLTVVDVDDIAHSEDHVLAYPALVRMVYRLQDELHAYAEQLVATRAELATLREKVERWEADS